MSQFTKQQHKEHLEEARKDVGRESQIRQEQDKTAADAERRKQEEQSRRQKEQREEELGQYRQEAEARVGQREEEARKEEERQEMQRREEEQKLKDQEHQKEKEQQIRQEQQKGKEQEQRHGAKEQGKAQSQEKGKHPMTSFRNVAIALDDSVGSAAALNWTLENIVRPKTDVVQVVSVGPHDSYITELTSMAKSDKGHEEISLEPGPDESKELIEMRSVLKKAQDTIEEFCTKNEEKISYMLFPVKGANAKDNIVHFCKDHQADLLILGSSGASGLRRMVLGSTSEYVLRNAPCPVLVVREVEGKTTQ